LENETCVVYKSIMMRANKSKTLTGESEEKMSEISNVYSPMNCIREYNALAGGYAKLEERANAAQIERISILLEAKALNSRYEALSDSQRKNEFSPDFCHMIEILGSPDSDPEGSVKALRDAYNP